MRPSPMSPKEMPEGTSYYHQNRPIVATVDNVTSSLRPDPPSADTLSSDHTGSSHPYLKRCHKRSLISPKMNKLQLGGYDAHQYLSYQVTFGDINMSILVPFRYSRAPVASIAPPRHWPNEGAHAPSTPKLDDSPLGGEEGVILQKETY